MYMAFRTRLKYHNGRDSGGYYMWQYRQGKRHEGTFWVDDTVLQLVQEGGYKGLCVGKYQTIQLIYVSFTVYKACLNFK